MTQVPAKLTFEVVSRRIDRRNYLPINGYRECFSDVSRSRGRQFSWN